VAAPLARALPAPTEEAPRYDRRSLSYANTFPSPWTRAAIRALEALTARRRILARVRAFERRGAPRGQAFWTQALEVMGVEVLTPPEQVARIPREGPVVLVANHPHGLVDGMVLAELVGRVRPDYRILARSILTGIDAAASAKMIPVPFPHEVDAQARMLAMRSEALAQLAAGGLVALFPSGVVASAASAWGPPVEAEWNPFTAKLLRLSGASVLPVFFPGANSRAYQVAARLSPTLRQGLLLHEVGRAFDRPQAPVVGEPIPPGEVAARLGDPRALMAWLRARTLALGPAA
jgi:putative hemolysin